MPLTSTLVPVTSTRMPLTSTLHHSYIRCREAARTLLHAWNSAGLSVTRRSPRNQTITGALVVDGPDVTMLHCALADPMGWWVCAESLQEEEGEGADDDSDGPDVPT
eukprot:9499042-Pyramimonas_sp.AAC.1